MVRLATYLLSPALLMVISMQVYAAAMTMIGSSAAGQECYTNAKIVSEKNFKKLADIEPCNIALREDQLNKRDKAATLVNRGLILQYRATLKRPMMTMTKPYG